GYEVSEIRNILNNLNWEKALSLTNKYQRTSLFLEQKKIQDRSLLTIPLDGIKPLLLPSSLSNGLYLSEIINSYILNSRYHPKKDFSDLKISFAAVATDFDNGKRVVLNRGNLSESIKASLTFPLLYTPIKIKDRNLVDGGLSANIPNDVAKTLGADMTIVVNTTSPLKSNQELDDPLNTADQILSIAMEQLNGLQLEDANVVINPDISNYSSTDYSNLDYLILEGEKSAKKLIDTITTKIDSLELSESKYFNNFVINPNVVIISEFNDSGLEDTLSGLTNNYFEKYTSIEKNLKMLYRTGSYSSVYATITRDGLTATISYNLVSNPVLKAVVLNDSSLLNDSLIYNFKKNNISKPVNVYDYYKFYDDLLGALRRKNYSLTEISRFYFDHSNNSLNIEFNSGKIRDIELSGNKTTNDNVIFREINIDTGLPVRKTNLDVSIEKVMSTNLFSQVSFDYVYNRKFSLPLLKVKLIEKNTKALRFSLKVDNERNLQLLLDIRDENIFGSAVEAGAFAAGGLRNRIYQFEVKSNQFFSLPLTFNYNLYYNFRDINRYTQSTDSLKNEFSVDKIGEYRDIKYGMSFLFGTQLERFGTIYSQVIAEKQRIKNKFDSQNLARELQVIKLKFGGIFDTQDRLPFPTKGVLLNLFYETAKNISERNLSYIKIFTRYEQFFTIAKSQTLKPVFNFGFVDRTAPLTEQFSLGGEKSFFGMVEDELRGRQVFSTSFEYRYM
ncbi:MAG: BamA/TamA family outer membrane protein, partial [Bacteroidota bacterium]|nr:BamA/TamA family outer membrane protein [Bacteroidota bacterium]